MRPLIALALLACGCASPPPSHSDLVAFWTVGSRRVGVDDYVSIEVRSTTVSAVIDQFRRQVPGMRFLFDGSGWSSRYRVSHFIVRDEPWRNALAAFAVLTGAEVNALENDVIHISRRRLWAFSESERTLRTLGDLVAGIGSTSVDPGIASTMVFFPPYSGVAAEKYLRDLVASIEGVLLRRDGDGFRIVPWSVEAIAEDLEGSADPADAAEVERLIDALDAIDPADRDDAEAALEAKGARILPVLAKAFRSAGGERKVRLQALIRRLWRP